MKLRYSDELIICCPSLAMMALRSEITQLRAERRKNKSQESNILVRNSLQTDEETNNIGLDSSFDEEINDEGSICIENNYETMETQIRNGNLDSFSQIDCNHRRIKTLLPKEEQRLNIINEIVETEKKYVHDLKFIVEFYKQPLKNNRILTRNELEVMFVNLDELIPINAKFLNSLIMKTNYAKQKGYFPLVGEVFIEHLPKMRVYSKFVSGKRFGEELILEKMKYSSEFSNFINKIFEMDSGDFRLKKMLLLPMQRLTQYQLLLEKLTKTLPESDLDYKNVIKASRMIIDMIKSINNEVGKIDDLERLDWLEAHVNIKEGMGFKFQSETNIMGQRCIIYYGPLVKENEFNKGKDLFGILFNDSLLLIEANESIHSEIFKAKKLQQLNIYKYPMLLDSISSVQSKILIQNGSEFSFQILLNNKEMNFRTTNPTLKNEWVKQLSKSIDKYKQQKNAMRNPISLLSSQKEPVGRFLLVLMEAQDLVYDSEQPKAFCEVEMGGKKFFSQQIDSSNPKWNLSMQFSIYDVNKDSLNVIVYNSKQFSPNVFLGKTEIRMANILRDQMKESQENGPIPITRCFRLSNVQSGKLILKMSLSIFN